VLDSDEDKLKAPEHGPWKVELNLKDWSNKEPPLLLLVHQSKRKFFIINKLVTCHKEPTFIAFVSPINWASQSLLYVHERFKLFIRLCFSTLSMIRTR
jgi:hypothetical protein